MTPEELNCASGELVLEGVIEGEVVSGRFPDVEFFDLNDTGDLNGIGTFWVDPVFPQQAEERAIFLSWVAPLAAGFNREGWGRVSLGTFFPGRVHVGNCEMEEPLPGTMSLSEDASTVGFVLRRLRREPVCEGAIVGEIVGCYGMP